MARRALALALAAFLASSLAPALAAASPHAAEGAAARTDASSAEAFAVAARRALHRVPELAYGEHETSALVASYLRDAGVEHTTGFGNTTAVVAQIGTGAEPCVLLRADMDALPIAERAAVPDELRSTNEGAMHACGHDGHVAMLLGAAKALQERHLRGELKGTVRLLFQPAEEGGGGAKRVIDAGLMGLSPRASAAFALHVWPYPAAPTGTVLGRAGPVMAATAAFRARVVGRGGHAALPHTNVDPVVASAAAVMALQALVSRETAPHDSAVVSVTRVEAGDTYNVIPDEVLLAGTIRALTRERHASLQRRVSEVVAATAAVYGCEGVVEWGPDGRVPYPPTVNDAKAWGFAAGVAEGVLGPGAVRETDTQMTAEDFSFIGEAVPSAYLLLGAHNESAGATHALHSQHFVLDEAALKHGVALHVALASAYLEAGGLGGSASAAGHQEL